MFVSDMFEICEAYKKYLLGKNLSTLHLKPAQLTKLQLFIKLATPGKSALQISLESEGRLESGYCAALRKAQKLTRRQVKYAVSYGSSNDGKKALADNPELRKLHPTSPRQLGFPEVFELVLKGVTAKSIKNQGGTTHYIRKAYRAHALLRSGMTASVLCKMCFVSRADAVAVVTIFNEFEKSKAGASAAEATTIIGSYKEKQEKLEC